MNSSNLEVVVVRTGTANLASVFAGLSRAGALPRIAAGPEEIRSADRVVLPGVGTLAAALDRLSRDGNDEALTERVRSGRPLLAVCLGLQLLLDGSEESPGAPGLGAVRGTATRFPDDVSVPQLGWNRVSPDIGCSLVESGHAYFANSYRLEAAPAEWNAAFCDHGGTFVAAIERGSQLACQFHPELSGAWGIALLRRWLESRGGKEVRTC